MEYILVKYSVILQGFFLVAIRIRTQRQTRETTKKEANENAIVMCTDPYINDPSFFKLNEVLTQCKIIFIGCPHAEYKNVNLGEVEVVNCWEQ